MRYIMRVLDMQKRSNGFFVFFIVTSRASIKVPDTITRVNYELLKAYLARIARR